MRWWPLTLRGIAVLAVAIGAFIVARQWDLIAPFILAVAFGISLVVCAASLWLPRAKLAARRSVSDEATSIDSAVIVRLSMNGGRLPGAGLRWRDTSPRSLIGVSEGTLDVSTPSVLETYQITGTKRGLFHVGPLRVVATDALGLTRRTFVAPETTALAVGPCIVTLQPLANDRLIANDAMLNTSSRVGEGVDNPIARPYVPGDEVRRVHWRATAHRGELMVRQAEQETTPSAIVVLDTAGWSADSSGFETALSVAASIAFRLVHDGFAVAMWDASGTPLTRDLLEPHDLAEMLGALASIEPREANSETPPFAHLHGSFFGPILWVGSRMPPQPPATRLPVALVVGTPAQSDAWRAVTIAESAPPHAISAAWAQAIGARRGD